MNDEIGKPVVGYEGLYEVSDLGRVRSFRIRKGGFIMKPYLCTGYPMVALYKDKKPHKVHVHRLVAQAFIGDVQGMEVNHLNGIRVDNRLDNLEIVTRLENVQHAWDTGLSNSIGDNHVHSKLRENQIPEIRLLLENTDLTQAEIARLFNVSRECIKDVKSGKSWKHVK